MAISKEIIIMIVCDRCGDKASYNVFVVKRKVDLCNRCRRECDRMCDNFDNELKKWFEEKGTKL